MLNDRYYFKKLAEKFLNEETTEQENEELFDWMKDNSELRMMIANDLEDSDDEMPESMKRRIYKRIVNGDGSKRTARPSRWLSTTRMLVAACAVLAVAVGVLAYRQVSAAPMQTKPLEVITEATNRSKLQLPDGTQMHLNAMSALTYNLDTKKKERVVHLDGEGYFEVAPDKNTPFKIITNGMEVLCLGTKFDIKNYKEDNSAKVILKEGSVKVTSGTQEIIMEPGTCVTYDKVTGNLTQSKVQKDSAREWISGYSYYHNENLENIVNELSRTYGKRFVITSPEIGNETFSGYLGRGALDDVLEALAMASGISYKHVNDSTVLIFNNKK